MTTTHAPTHRTSWILGAAGLVALVTVLLVASLTASTDTTASGQSVTPATASEPDRGAGDSCALRHEVRGGFIEGLDPANRCGAPTGQARTGGRLP